MTERKMTEVEMYSATLALCVLPNLKTASGEVLTWEGVRTDDATSTRFLCADGGREHVATIYNNGRVYCYRAHKKNREIEDGDITAAFEHVCRELDATPVDVETKPAPEPPAPEVYACEPSGWVLMGWDTLCANNDNWERLDKVAWQPVGRDAYYGDNPKNHLRLYGKMNADGKIIPVGRLCPDTDTPHYTPLTLEECVEFGLSPHTPPAAEPTPTTGIKHDADKTTWWLMPWGAVKRVADNGALSSIFRAYADAAGRTYDAFAWAQLGHTIIARNLGESPRDGISDATMWQAFGEVHKVLEYGAAKYDAHNWQKVLGGPNGPQRYVEACRRHLMADAAGEVNDAESGLPHWAHALCCCLFLIYNAEAGGEK